MTFKGILDTIGNDAKKVFAFLGSSAGQTDIKVVEGAVDSGVAVFDPALAIPLQSAQNLLNNWMGEIFKVQALAAAAGAASGSSVQKAAGALTSITPQLTAWLQANGYSTANVTDEANVINAALVTVLNKLGSAGPAVPPAPPAA